MTEHAPKAALCHEWATTFGGADQVAAQLVKAIDVHAVFTYAAWESTIHELFQGFQVHTVGPAPATRHWQWFLPHMAWAWRSVDLADFDLIITSSHACVNSVRPRPGALMISYCHTPMRYAWEWRNELRRLPVVARPLWPPIAAAFRRADRRWAQRVDLFLANSRFVAGRIRDYYRKPSFVLHPPIDTSFWTPRPDPVQHDDYLLVSGRLVGYKRPDLAVRAATLAGASVVVAGSGPMLPALRRMQGKVRFVPNPTREELRELYRGARAYVFAGVEDFGMSLAEALACGTPVIAVAEGGALEIVEPGIGGVLVEDATADGLATAIRRFDRGEFEPSRVRRGSERFSVTRFVDRLRWVVDRAVERDWGAIRESKEWVPEQSRAT